MDDVGVDAWMMGARVAMMGTDLRVVTRRLRAYVRAIIIRDVMIDGDRRARRCEATRAGTDDRPTTRMIRFVFLGLFFSRYRRSTVNDCTHDCMITCMNHLSSIRVGKQCE